MARGCRKGTPVCAISSNGKEEGVGGTLHGGRRLKEAASVPSVLHMLLWEPHLLQPRLLKNREPASCSGSPPNLLRTESGTWEKGFHSHQDTFHFKIFIKIMIKPEKGITRNQPFARYFKNQQKKKRKENSKENPSCFPQDPGREGEGCCPPSPESMEVPSRTTGPEPSSQSRSPESQTPSPENRLPHGDLNLGS